MGLSGNLEDMPLQDILQIIHHSKKSGTLYLTRGADAGTVVFQDGLIIQCFAPGKRIDIGKALVDARRISPEVLAVAVAAQAEGDAGKRLGSILVDRGAVRFEDIEAVVKLQIQSAAAELLTWQEGTFNLVLEELPRYDSIALALDELALRQGMDTQHLLLEALRTWDEATRDERERDDEAAPPAAVADREDDGGSTDATRRVAPLDGAEMEDLRRQLDELRSQRETASMTMSLLKIVARRFERAIFFYVTDAYLVPLGAFGRTPEGASIAQLARDMSFAPHPGSPLDAAITGGVPVEIDLTESDLSTPILERVGWPATGTACLLPLASEGRTVALLYADQGQRERPIGSLSAFEPLLAQAARSLQTILAAAHLPREAS